jgi:hypothetical protein
MNCQQFDNIVVELARVETPGVRRGPLMDAAAHADGTSHVAACARCAARLADEQALNAGLRAVAAADASKEAPRAVEAALLAAFRQHVAAPAANTAARTSAPVVVLHPRVQWLRWVVASAAAAAAIITLAVLGFSQLNGTTHSPQAPEISNTHQSPVKQVVPEPVAAPPVNRAVERTVENEPEPPQRIAYKPHATGPNSARPVKHPIRVNSPWDEARLVVNLGTVQADAPAEEVATDFIPVGYTPAPLDSGQVVRVKMPRSALATFGLPVNAERSQEPIKADVLYGADGLARAVRFIRD